MTHSPRPLSFAALLVLALSACSSGGGIPDSGPPPTASDYFNLNPGQCFLYALGDGGTAVVAVDIQPVVNPPGVKLVRTRAGGAADHTDFLTFDGGEALLDKTDDSASTGLTEAAYLPPYLPFLLAPLDGMTMVAPMAPTVISADDGMLNINTESNSSWSQTNMQPWTGFTGGQTSDAGFTETQITLSITNDAGPSLTKNWVTPGIGFTDLYLQSANGGFDDYLLINITSDDAGCMAP